MKKKNKASSEQGLKRYVLSLRKRNNKLMTFNVDAPYL